MDKDIYKLAKDFPDLKKIMENANSSSNDRMTANCNSFDEGKFPSFNSSVENICKKVEDYISTINVSYYYSFKESRCIYLYYWLYYYNDNNKKPVNEVKNLYHKLISDLDLTNCYIDEKIDYSTIADDEMSKLKDLQKMYTNVKNTTETACTNCKCLNECSQIYGTHLQTCNYNNNTYFCKELLNIKEIYDKQMINNECEAHIPKTLPSFQRYNITTLTLIPIFTTLFTPYGLSFRCAALKKRKQYNNINNEKNILELSEASSCVLRNNRYNILYNSK
ncbi:variable surface protein [Plasmodium gonderi]|uniref:Variable surface protein n=1 Tax=Plasmodium gonderi TaxID=77519 RepID=A0A1Y1JTC5_PLAGO|nr:variable surface protein [Plasmodium gonderi]GAW84387.1 variable surface protein [Plasmodium gonderi]